MGTVNFKPTAQKSYYGSSESTDFVGAVGRPSGRYAAYSMCFTLQPAAELTSLTIKLDPGANYSASAFQWAVTGSADWPGSFSNGNWNGAEEVTLTNPYPMAAGVTYYLWIVGMTSYYGYVTGVTMDTVTLLGTPVSYTVTLPTGDGYSAQPSEGYSSPVDYGQDFQFTVSIQPAYMKGEDFTVKANGTALEESGGVYTIADIRENKEVSVEGVMLGGVVYIDSGSGLDGYLVYVDNGTGWDHVLPYIDNGNSFDLYS